MPAEIISQWGEFEGKALVAEVNGPDIKAENGPGVEKVRINQSELQVKGDRITYQFPPHSYTMIRARFRLPASK